MKLTQLAEMPDPQPPAHGSDPMIPINEVFGPTIQGEGPFIGRACVFLRLHGCPVKCGGCDTHYTWDGSEDGRNYPTSQVRAWLSDYYERATRLGLVVSGGEPLIYYQNSGLRTLAKLAKSRSWSALETSGVCSRRRVGEDQSSMLDYFLDSFTSISWSPKITECLKPAGVKESAFFANAENIYRRMFKDPHNHCIKLVVLTPDDVKRVQEVDNRERWTASGFRVMLMPYGVQRDEILDQINRLVPILADTGYELSPRLHSIVWSAERQR